MDARKEPPGAGQNRYESDFGTEPKEPQTLASLPVSQGQSCPQHCPPSQDRDRSVLGGAMSVAEVALMLGCSAWTVRQKYLPQGLPHVRASAVGKIVFFREQVIDWILKRQQKKGGNRP